MEFIIYRGGLIYMVVEMLCSIVEMLKIQALRVRLRCISTYIFAVCVHAVVCDYEVYPFTQISSADTSNPNTILCVLPRASRGDSTPRPPEPTGQSPISPCASPNPA